MPSRRSKKTLVTFVAVLSAFGLSSGVAYAYWSSNGTGWGTATTGTSSNFTVTSDTATGSSLTPGVGTQTVGFHVKNAVGNATLRLNTVTVSVLTASGDTWNTVPGCSAHDYTVGTPIFSPGDLVGGGETAGTVTVSMINNLSMNQDGCKLAQVPLHFTAA